MKQVSAVAVAALVGLLSSSAAAIDRDACAVPYEEGQVLRKKRVYSAAKEQLEQCRARCPAVLAADCTLWEAEIKALTPTVLFQVHDPAGKALLRFRVSVDGTLLSDTPGGEPIPVDPGEHVFRFESPPFEPAGLHATLNDGEHRRVVDVTMTMASSPGGPVLSVPAVAPPSRTSSYVLFGIGGAALLAAGTLSFTGFVEKAHLEDTCAPSCNEGSLDAIRAVWIAGGVAAGVGLASLAAGLVAWPKGPSSKNGSLGWGPTVGVGTVGVAGRF